MDLIWWIVIVLTVLIGAGGVLFAVFSVSQKKK